MKPVIAIGCALQRDPQYHQVRVAYVDLIRRNGGIPVLLAPHELGYLDEINAGGLLLSGGVDVHPRFYGSPEDAVFSENCDPVRDQAEIAAVLTSWERGMPTVGICRGCQLINVAMRGKLTQNVSEPNAHAVTGQVRHRQNMARSVASHQITIEQTDGILASLFGKGEALWVNSFHHQAVKEAGDHLVITAKARDGVVEAIEGSGHPFLLGIQGHPEEISEPWVDRVFESFIAAAQRYSDP